MIPFGGELDQSSDHSDHYMLRNSVNYSKTFNEKHYFDATAGLEVNSSRNKGFASLSRGYLHDNGKKFAKIDPSEYYLYNQWLTNYSPSVTDATTNSISYYGILTYAYNDKYIFNFNIREDGSNQFGQNDNNRFNAIWSSSVRWNIHKESFLQNVKWLNNLALRGSYGTQGNALKSSPNLIAQSNGVNGISGQYESSLRSLENPNLTWEKTTSYNIGLDFMVLHGRLRGSLEHYRKKGEDLIVSRQVSVVNGIGFQDINKGDMLNKGFEGSLSAELIRKKDFGLKLNMNFYKNINEVTKSGIDDNYNYSDYLNGDLVVKGNPVGGFYSYKFAGLDEKGLPTFHDIEEPEHPTKEQMYDQVFTYSGNLNPDISGGFSLGVNYKNWSLNCSFTYSLGFDVRLARLYSSDGQSLPTPDQNMSAEFVNRWRKPGDENHTNIPVISDDFLHMSAERSTREIEIADNMWEMYNMSDLRVVPGDFLRLQNVSLSYQVPRKICDKMRIKGMSFRFSASNLFLWADSRLEGQDPEHMGLGNGTTPPLKSYGTGININF